MRPRTPPPPSADAVAVVTDAQLLQRALRSAVAAAAAGEATAAASSYALVVKVLLRKCFLVEELVLLALAMGAETRDAAAPSSPLPPPPPPIIHGPAAEQPVDVLASVQTLLPPGLDDEDYEEERAYHALKAGHEPHTSTHFSPMERSDGGVASPAGSPSSPAHGADAGHDATTARWIARLLRKVHPDALPVATLERICKCPLASATSNSSISGAQQQQQQQQPGWGTGDIDLLPQLKSSQPTSPTPSSPAATTAATAAASSASLSLLFATLLWNVACALWGEGFVEDAHHWLCAVDVRRLWRLYADVCRSLGDAAAAVPYASGEPAEEEEEATSMTGSSSSSSSRACALTWSAVLTEARAADAVSPTRGPSTAAATAYTATEATPQPCTGITLPVAARPSAPLPMVNTTTPCVGGDAAAAASAAEAEGSHDTATTPTTAAAAAAAAATMRTLAVSLRRLARRTSALRDCCALMMACQTAEDVFYVLYAMNYALAMQQCKYEQQQQEEREEGQRGGGGETSVTSGGLAELLIFATLLIEYFITKRAQRLLMDEGALLPADTTTTTTAAAAAAAPTAGGGGDARSGTSPHPQQQRRMDRAIRRASDEVVSTFTNGRCLTLYALESYGLPPPYDGDGESTTTYMLAPELPYVLVCNVLGNTLDFASLYRLSKVFHGVMQCRRGPRGHGGDEEHAAGAEPAHPNLTRRATHEERTLRRAWTAAATPSTAPATTSTSATADTAPPPPPSSSVVGDLLGLVKEAAAGLWHAGSGSSSGSAAQSTAAARPNSDGAGGRAPSRRSDVRPSFGCGEPGGEDVLAQPRGGSGYAERIAAARRERPVERAAATPWSAESAAAVSSENSSLADASSSSAPHISTAAAATTTPTWLSRAPRLGQLRDGAGPCALQSRGAAAAELLLPSTLLADAAAAVAPCLLAEEAEEPLSPATAAAATSAADAAVPLQQTRDVDDGGGGGGYRSPASLSFFNADASAQQPPVLLHTAEARWRSCTPTEAISLRLLTVLYRYPKLHTLEPVAARHVDLVATELNKALHVLQTAMRERFGEHWWLHWRSLREEETSRYYARAVADAQGGGHPLCSPTTSVVLTSEPCGDGDAEVESRAAAAAVVVVASPPALLGAAAAPRGWTCAAAPVVCEGVRPPPTPPPPPPAASTRGDVALSSLWSARPLYVPSDEALRERRQPRRHDPAAAVPPPAAPSASSTEAGSAATRMTREVTWDAPPPYTPVVSVDFAAFTTTSVETQQNTRRLLESLQRRELASAAAAAATAEDDVVGPGASLLSRECRRLLHDELPLLQQYSPWRVLYSTRVHGISLSTLYANCRREAERHACAGYTATPMLADTRPMLLVLELPESTTMDFAQDDAGVLEASASADPATPPTQQPAGRPRRRHHKQFIGAFLSDLLRLETRRYYGSSECFVFQLLVPGAADDGDDGDAAAPGSTPQLRVYRASGRNAHYINCRASSIVIGGGDGGSSLYLDDTLLHGATSRCATFDSPVLSTWTAASAAASAAAAAEEVGTANNVGQSSLSVLNVEVIVMDA
ncbi:TLD domain protein [Novymonas esmeraldas]|uniref:TLD domain protein n=1 Tax=Novymonas esmeraldas TaxID=1808958 RepID=A0AAW0EPC0_9TRYP